MRKGTLSIVAVGKIQIKHWAQAQADYTGRLKRYTSLEIIEVKDALGQGFPDKVAQAREGHALLSASVFSRRRIALAPLGRVFDSQQFAVHLQRQLETYRKLAFVIGGPLGLSSEVIEASHEQLSLSSMTLPHELARILLLEQLYRAFTILAKEKYHR